MDSKITRRQILTGAALAAAAGAAVGQRPFSALANVTMGPRLKETGGDVLVVIFLRGGADGLNIVAPYFEDDYYKLRPSLGLLRPTDRTGPANARALDLDGRFGLHPVLAPLLPLYHAGQFAAVHAIGSGDQTRSHFEAMATMERGIARDTGVSSGWLARYLASTQSETESPLRAVAIADTMPDSLRGATNATALLSLADYRLTAHELARPHQGPRTLHDGPTLSRTDAIEQTLRGLYGKDTPDKPVDTLRSAGNETLAAMDSIKRLDPAHYRPAIGAAYPNGDVGTGLRQAACLIKGDVGLEIACLDMGGWDSHITQGRESGFQPSRLTELGGALAAFATDLGEHFAHVTTLVMTEFGRRAYENTSLGTDHGRGSVMFLLGGGVAGGKVYTDWPGLAAEKLEDHGDLRVTTDYRDVLSEVLLRRLKTDRIAEVFPEYTPRPHNVVKPI